MWKKSILCFSYTFQNLSYHVSSAKKKAKISDIFILFYTITHMLIQITFRVHERLVFFVKEIIIEVRILWQTTESLVNFCFYCERQEFPVVSLCTFKNH